MAPRVDSELLLVGSLPADSAGTETMREHARVVRTVRKAQRP